MSDLLTGLAMVLVIEGLVYAVFPTQMQRMMEMARALPPASLRNAGLGAAITGVALVWLIRG